MKPVSLSRIICTVSEQLNIEPAAVRGNHGRHPRIAQYRQIVAVCARRHTLASFEDIADAVAGARNKHSTYSLAYRRGVENPEIVAAADQIAARLASR